MLADNSYGEPVIKNSRFVNNRNGLSLRGSIINKEKVINLDVSNNENYGIVSSSDTRGNTGEIWFEDNRVNEYIQIPYDKCSSKECNSNIKEDSHTKERIQEFNNKTQLKKIEISNMNINSLENAEKDELIIIENTITNPIEIDNNVKIISDNPQRTDFEAENEEYCIELGENTNVRVHGLTFENCGIDATDTKRNWEIVNSKFKGESKYGIFATESEGNWIIENKENIRTNIDDDPICEDCPYAEKPDYPVQGSIVVRREAVDK